MDVQVQQRSRADKLSRAPLIAAFAAWFICGPTCTGIAADELRPEEARAAEQLLLGSEDEASRLADYRQFTGEIAVQGAVDGSFDASLTRAGVPAVAMLETTVLT